MSNTQKYNFNISKKRLIPTPNNNRQLSIGNNQYKNKLSKDEIIVYLQKKLDQINSSKLNSSNDYKKIIVSTGNSSSNAKVQSNYSTIASPSRDEPNFNPNNKFKICTDLKEIFQKHLKNKPNHTRNNSMSKGRLYGNISNKNSARNSNNCTMVQTNKTSIPNSINNNTIKHKKQYSYSQPNIFIQNNKEIKHKRNLSISNIPAKSDKTDIDKLKGKIYLLNLEIVKLSSEKAKLEKKVEEILDINSVEYIIKLQDEIKSYKNATQAYKNNCEKLTQQIFEIKSNIQKYKKLNSY